MSTAVKSWVVLALIFIAGALSGTALTLVFAPHFDHLRPRPHDLTRIKTDMMDGLTRELQLTSDQQAKIEPIIGEAAKEMHEVHQDEVLRIGQIFRLTNDQMAPLLTADQKAQLQKLEDDGGASMFFGRPRGWGPPGMRMHEVTPAPETNAPPH